MASKISFVVAGMPTGYPGGGVDVIFKLAYKLSEDGFDVSILSLKNIDEYTRERERAKFLQ